MMFYTYLLIDPRNNEVFYVGKGSGNRYKNHLTGNNSNRIVQGIIGSIRRDGLEPIVSRDVDRDDEDLVFGAEALLQKWFEPRANIFKCGVFGFAGGKSIPKPESFKRLMSEKMKGREFSDETRAKMSEGQRKARAEGRIVSMPPSNKGNTYNMRLVICPHCGKQGKGGNMSRYHFDKCKHIAA